MTKQFTITYDYLCPFAHIANEAVVESVEGGADYDVTFAPFSLYQNHLDDGDTAVWARPTDDAGPGVLAHLWALAVRHEFPEQFSAWHVAAFNAKHDDGRDLSDQTVLAEIAAGVGIDADAISKVVASGTPAKTLAAEHADLVDRHDVFGVPTFISNGEAVFVRLMERHKLDDLDRVIGMLGWTNVNEFKRTTVPR